MFSIKQHSRDSLFTRPHFIVRENLDFRKRNLNSSVAIYTNPNAYKEQKCSLPEGKSAFECPIRETPAK